MNNKNTKTILFASLISVMILPFNGMSYAMAENEVVVGDYEKYIKQQDFFKELNNDDKHSYIKNLRESKENHNSYEKEVDKLLEKTSNISLALIIENEKINPSQVKIDILNQKLENLIPLFEKLGVVTKEKLDQDRDYWFERALTSSNKINDITEISTLSSNSKDIVSVHTDDVSLQNKAELAYPCFVWPITGVLQYCWAWDHQYGPGTVSVGNTFIPHNGDLEMVTKTCLVSNGGHSVVYFHMITSQLVTTNIGTASHDITKGGNLWIVSDCVQYKDYVYSLAGFSVHLANTLDNDISV